MHRSDSRIVIVVGDTLLASRLCSSLDAQPRTRCVHLDAPSDLDLMGMLTTEEPDAVVIAVHEDVSALRYALVVAHGDPALRTVVTVFDQTMKNRLGQLWPHLEIVSPAEIATPSLAGPCVVAGALAAWSDDAGSHVLRDPVEGPVPLPASRRPSRWPVGRRLLRSGRLGRRPHIGHTSSTRMLVVGTTGAGLVLLGDWTWLMWLGVPASEALYEAARVVSTVGPATPHGGDAYRVFAALSMLATIAFSAVLTAGLVDRFIEPRLVGLFGARRPPRAGHVVVVGMGQVGLRLCVQLHRLGVRVVGLERDLDAPALRVARALKIPVVHGHGTDRLTLERLGSTRARAIASVGSDDLENIAVAVSASAVAPRTPILVRTGEHEAITRPQSLRALGHLCDVADLAAVYVGELLNGCHPDVVATDGETTYVVVSGRCFESTLRTGGGGCGHGGTAPTMLQG